MVEMVLPGRLIILWLFWFIAGICGVVILCLFICYCRMMPRQHKSFDEGYTETKKDYHCVKNSVKVHQECSYNRIKQSEVHRYVRPVSYGGSTHYYSQVKPSTYHNASEYAPSSSRAGHSRCPDELSGSAVSTSQTQYASYGMLDDIEDGKTADSLKTRSLPAFHKAKQRPTSSEDDLQNLYAELGECVSRKYKQRMRNEHAAIIALSKSQSQNLDANAVIVYDQRTAL